MKTAKPPRKTAIVYDTVLKRPACPILQAVMGGSPHITQNFPGELWLLEPTPDMHCYSVTDEEMKQLIRITESAAQGSGTGRP